jgi:hypothetical protein
MAMVREMVARRDAESTEVAQGLTREDPARAVVAEPVGQRVTIETHSWSFDDCDRSAA